jgi:biopolymer transport protein ExbD
MARKNRSMPEINAGSMADIAFLLLIFFLVTTSIDSDKGIPINLPPKLQADVKPPKIRERNLLNVLINSNDNLLVDGKNIDVSELCDYAKKHIVNNGVDPNFSESPDQAIVSLKNDRGTSYGAYIQVQNELKRAYNEIRDDYSYEKFGKPFAELEVGGKQYDAVVTKYPQKISEAEPENVNNLD